MAAVVLSTVLNQPKFLSIFLRTHRERLEDRYNLSTDILRLYSIPYMPSNAGCFIWVDLSEHIVNEPGETPLERERALNCRLFSEGIHLAPSEAFHGEQCGWFRVSFTVDKDTLETGLSRYYALQPY